MKNGVKRKPNLIRVNPFTETITYVNYDEEATDEELKCLDPNQYVGYFTPSRQAAEPVIISGPSTSTTVDIEEPQHHNSGILKQIKTLTQKLF